MPKMTTPAYPATLDKIPLDLARDMRRAVSEQALRCRPPDHARVWTARHRCQQR